MPKPTSLMTQYAAGHLISRELQTMMVDYAADARFDRDLTDDIDLYVDRYSNTRYRCGKVKDW